MVDWKKFALANVLVLGMLFGPLPAMAEHLDKPPPVPAAIVADLVLARPLGLAVTVVGAAVFFASMPVLVLAGNSEEVWSGLVLTPGAYTLTRPLGRFE